MDGPLKRLKILDFTKLLPGPYATMTLADMEAQALRIISGSRPALAAFVPPCLPGTNLSCATAALEGYFKLRLTTGNTLSKFTHRIE